MNRIDRLFGILITLQSKKFVQAEHIAGKFEISVRTVYRDIKALSELGVPVGFENNKGYFIVQGYFLPPVSFTNEEANALILMASLADKYTDQSIAKHSDSALNKIKTLLKVPQKDQVEELNSQIKVYRAPSEQNRVSFLTEIQNAISNKHVVKMEYKNNNQEVSKREAEPIGLVFYAMDWHMIAWCWKRNEYRDFKVARIQSLQNSGTIFKKKKHIALNDYIRSRE